MDEPDLTCPACSSKDLERGTTEIEVPHFGSVVVYYLRCKSCGYRINDFGFQGNFPKEDKVEIKGKKDLEIKIVRGKMERIKKLVLYTGRVIIINGKRPDRLRDFLEGRETRSTVII